MNYLCRNFNLVLFINLRKILTELQKTIELPKVLAKVKNLRLSNLIL